MPVEMFGARMRAMVEEEKTTGKLPLIGPLFAGADQFSVKYDADGRRIPGALCED